MTQATDELTALTDELRQLNRRERLINRIGRQLLIGVAFGLGSVLGATLVLSVLIYLLTNIEIIPIVGEWAARIVEEIEARR